MRCWRSRRRCCVFWLERTQTMRCPSLERDRRRRDVPDLVGVVRALARPAQRLGPVGRAGVHPVAQRPSSRRLRGSTVTNRPPRLSMWVICSRVHSLQSAT